MSPKGVPKVPHEAIRGLRGPAAAPLEFLDLFYSPVGIALNLAEAGRLSSDPPSPRQTREIVLDVTMKEIEKQREVAYCPATTTWLANASSPSTDTRYCCPGTIDWPPWSG